MGEWTILTLPIALLLNGAALFFCLFERFYRAAHGIFTMISALLSILAAACSLIMGAELWECAGVLLVFLLLNMGVGE